jgi:hypothetical protein
MTLGKDFIFFSRRYPMLVRMWFEILPSQACFKVKSVLIN